MYTYQERGQEAKSITMEAMVKDVEYLGYEAGFIPHGYRGWKTKKGISVGTRYANGAKRGQGPLYRYLGSTTEEVEAIQAAWDHALSMGKDNHAELKAQHDAWEMKWFN